MEFTKRNHSNPCFWTAYWNLEYYNYKVHKTPIELLARQQEVFSLNVKSDKIISTPVNNVHYDKNLGVAEITPESAKKFCKNYFPDKYEKLSKYYEEHPETLYMDFEDILNGIEKTPAYQTLISVIEKERLETAEEKANLSCFIAIQNIRSHAILKSMIEIEKEIGVEKFEYFWILKNILSNPNSLLKLVIQIACSQWLIYRTLKHTFPLPDSPILVRNGSIMIAISPRILIEINANIPKPEDFWLEKDYISKSKMNEYRKRCISNTFKEIIFNDKAILEEWKKTSEFKKRMKLISNTKSYNKLVTEEENRQIWKINAFGNIY
jgi:hypothetical protein